MKELKQLICIVMMAGLPMVSFAELVVEEEIVPADEVERAVVVEDRGDYYNDEGEAYPEEEVVYQEAAPAPAYKPRRKRIRRKVIRPRKADGRPSLDAKVREKTDEVTNKIHTAVADAAAKAIDGIQINIGDKAKHEADAYPTEEEVVKAAPTDVVAPAPVYQVDAPIAGNEVTADYGSSEGMGISLFPIIGLTGMELSTYDAETKVSVGAGIEGEVANNVVIGVSYVYSQFDISGFNLGAIPLYRYYGQTNSDIYKYEYNLNMIDVGMKYVFGSRASRIRPYIGVGGGYAMGYLNRTQEYIDEINRRAPGYVRSGALDDYETTAWLGFIQGGVDFAFSKTFGIGLSGRYYTTLSSSGENSYESGNSLRSAYGPYSRFGGPVDPELTQKQLIGNSIQDTNYYSGLLHVKISF